MIFRRLSVALLSLMASERADSTDVALARHVLVHRQELPAMGVRELAAACHVGAGTVSRFCRHAGFANFDDLRRAAAEGEDQLEELHEGPLADAWAERVPPAIARAARSVDMAALRMVADEIVRHERVSAFGLLKAEAAAICLQADLLMLGHEVTTAVSYADQLAHILSAPADELVVVFSGTGSYFEDVELDHEQRRHLVRTDLWMVAPREAVVPSFVSGLVPFDSDGDQLAHPFHLQAIAAIVAQEVARRC